MWRNATHQDEHPLPIPVLPRSSAPPSAAAESEDRGGGSVSPWCPHTMALPGVEGAVPGVPSLGGQPRLCVLPGPGAEQVAAEDPGCGVTPQQQQHPNPAFFLFCFFLFVW